MTSRAFADGQMAATFRMRMGRHNPELLQSFLQSRIAGPSGGAAPEQAEAGAAGGGGEENAATVSTSPASSEGVLLKSRRRTYTLTYTETDGDFQEEDDSEATLEGAGYIQELASIMAAGEEMEEMELDLSDID